MSEYTDPEYLARVIAEATETAAALPKSTEDAPPPTSDDEPPARPFDAERVAREIRLGTVEDDNAERIAEQIRANY